MTPDDFVGLYCSSESQCGKSMDISESDDRTKRFYGIDIVYFVESVNMTMMDETSSVWFAFSQDHRTQNSVYQISVNTALCSRQFWMLKKSIAIQSRRQRKVVFTLIWQRGR